MNTENKKTIFNIIAIIALLILLPAATGIAADPNAGDKSPLEGYPVFLFLAEDLEAYKKLPEEQQTKENFPNPVRITVTDSEGKYTFDDLEPGEYIAALESHYVDDVKYSLPTELTDDNKFAVDWENFPFLAYTEVIVVEAGQAVEDIDAGLTPEMAMMMKAARGGLYTIDLSLLGTAGNNSGPGWTYSGNAYNVSPNTGTLTFDNTASGNQYTIVKSVGNSYDHLSTRNITVNSDVNNLTIRFDGVNINIQSYVSGGVPLYHYRTTTNITINGGSNNRVIYDNVVNLYTSTIDIKGAASYTEVEYLGTSHLYYYADSNNGYLNHTVNNAGTDTTVVYDGVNIRRAVFNHNSTVAGDKLKMYLRGENIFAYSFEVTLLDYANLDLFLSGSTKSIYEVIKNPGQNPSPATTTNQGGFITIPANSKLVIDSEDAPGSSQGSLTLSRNAFSYAVIGGSTHSGLITINGGTLDIKNSAITYVGNGAAIGGGYHPTTYVVGAGNVIINGGTVTAESNGEGAAIGGANGTLGVGNVTINNGTVNAKSTGGGAAIGGGRGATGNVTIYNGTINATTNVNNLSGSGAAIGGGRDAMGVVTIHGGDITAEAGANYGAAIGGGSVNSASSKGIPNVNIHGGNFNLKSNGGACVGTGGSLLPYTLSSASGFVNIYGGTFFADYADCNAIGGGQNIKPPLVLINKEADIVAFARPGRYGALNIPGIETSANPNYTNLGDGFFVNGNFDWSEKVTDALFVVYEASNPDVPIRIVPVSFIYMEFSFTTGETVKNYYRVFTGTYTNGLKEVVCKATTHTNCAIYSTKKGDDYKINGHYWNNYWNSMSVKYGSGAAFPLKVPVTEYYIDKFGNKIQIVENYIDVYNNPAQRILPNPNTALIDYDAMYAVSIVNTPGYVLKGFKWDTAPTGSQDFTPGNPYNPPNQTQIKTPRTIYLIYAPIVDVDVTISKVVTGSFANKTQSFDFALYSPDLKGATVTVEYKIGGAVSNGTLTFDPTSGKADFQLKHGQSVTLKNISSETAIKLEEIFDHKDYVTKINGVTGTDTGPSPITVGDQPLTFHVENNRITVIPTGVDETTRGVWPLVLAISAILVGLSVFAAIKFSRKNAEQKAK